MWILFYLIIQTKLWWINALAVRRGGRRGENAYTSASVIGAKRWVGWKRGRNAPPYFLCHSEVHRLNYSYELICVNRRSYYKNPHKYFLRWRSVERPLRSHLLEYRRKSGAIFGAKLSSNDARAAVAEDLGIGSLVWSTNSVLKEHRRQILLWFSYETYPLEPLETFQQQPSLPSGWFSTHILHQVGLQDSWSFAWVWWPCGLSFRKMSGIIGNMQSECVRSRSYESINTKVTRVDD